MPSSLTSFDPDDTDVPVYVPPKDEPRIKNEVNVKRGRNSRRRGASLEKRWEQAIAKAANRAGLTVMQMPERRGIRGAEDVRWILWSFEVKGHQARWCAPGERTKAWQQSRRLCKPGYTPMVVEGHMTANKTYWRVYAEEGAEPVEGMAWIQDRILEMK